jgi:hypothetical protein
MSILAIFWIFLSVVVGVLGRKTRFGFWGNFIFSLFLSPLFVLLIIFLSPTRKGDFKIKDLSDVKEKKKKLRFEESQGIN